MTEPVLALPELSNAVAPEPSSKRQCALGISTLLELLTVTVIAEDVVVFPAASRATAVIVCWPLLAVVVFHVVV
jgi:hypothetical protein